MPGAMRDEIRINDRNGQRDCLGVGAKPVG